jgi:tetratricopeptide (TPR) repeat protein
MYRQVQLRLCLALLGGAIVFAVCTHFLHAYQVKRTAGFLLSQADKAEEDGNLPQAAAYVSRYLTLVPKDADARIRYGFLLSEKLAKTPKDFERAYLILDQAVRDGGDREDLRRRVIQLALRPSLSLYSDAAQQIDSLFKADIKDAQLLTWRAQCYEASGDYKKARERLEEAVSLSKDPEDFVRLAVLMRQQPLQARLAEKSDEEMLLKADQKIDDMVAKLNNDYSAYLASARYHRAYAATQQPDKARQRIEYDVAKALELAPSQAEVLLAAGELAREKGQLSDARGYLEDGLKRYPDNWEFYIGLSKVELDDRQPTAAIAVLKRGLVRLPEQIDLLWNLAELYLDQAQNREAVAVFERLKKGSPPAVWLDYLQCRLLIGEEKWGKAVRLLERTYPRLLGQQRQRNNWFNANLARSCSFLLAYCFERMGDPDRAAAAYGRIIADDPLSARGRLGFARMEWGSGRVDNAVKEYRQLMKAPIRTSLYPTPVDDAEYDFHARAFVECAQLLIERDLANNQAKWSEVTQILDQAATLKPAPIEVALLRAEVLAAQKQFDVARNTILDQFPDPAIRPVKAWIGLSVLEDRQGNAKNASSLLQEAEYHLADSFELRLAWIRHYATQKQSGAVALAKLAQDLDAWPRADQRLILQELATAYGRLGEANDSVEQWRSIARTWTHDVGSRLVLFDLAYQADDEAAVSRLIRELKDIEQDEGTLWRYCEARRLIRQAQLQKDKKEMLDDASQLLSAVSTRRPGWHRALVAQAQIDEQRGKFDAAIRKYQDALSFGNQDPAVIRRVVALLTSRGRYPEVGQILQKLGDRPSSLSDLDRVAAEVALVRQDANLALNLAEKAVSRDSQDFRDHIWLGRMFAATGNPAEADAEFRGAIRLKETHPDCWVALIEFLHTKGDKVNAALELEQAHKKLPPAQALLPLAHCHELLGQVDEAKRLFDKAVQAKPGDGITLQAVGMFYLRCNQRQEAKRLLEKALSLKDRPVSELAEAQRMLALLVASSGNYQETQRALEMLHVLPDAGPSSDPTADLDLADERVKVAILARHPDARQRRRAIAILEKIARLQMMTDDDKVGLAQLYESVGNWPQARDQWLNLVDTAEKDLQKPGPRKIELEKALGEYLTHLCAGLLRHKALAEAQTWFAKLEKLEPDSFHTLNVKALILAAQDRGSEAVAPLMAIADKQADSVLPAAIVLEEIRQYKGAEELYRCFVTQSVAEAPESRLTLARYLGRRNQPDDALDQCEKAWLDCRRPEAVASACVVILHTAKCGPQHWQRVAAWLERESAKKPSDTKLLDYLANVKRLQKDYQGVIALSRRILDLDKNDARTMANLAWMLVFTEKNPPEALRLINRAREIQGPQPWLLDTQAVVLLKMDKAAEAVKLLETAIAESPTADKYFHLAQAHADARNRAAAVDAFQHAKQLGLGENTVDPLEREAYLDLQRLSKG